MEALMILILILALTALILYINYLIAREFYLAAYDKGYTSKKYLWIPFLLGMIGYILVIALPDRGTTKTTNANSLTKQTYYFQQGSSKSSKSGDIICCDRCGAENSSDAKFCGKCRQKLSLW